MMPLVLAEKNKKIKIRNVGGKRDLKQHLESLGISPGVDLTVVKKLSSSLIVSVKGVKVAIDENTAKKIYV